MSWIRSDVEGAGEEHIFPQTDQLFFIKKVQIFLCVKVFWGVCPDAFDQRCKNLHRSGVWVQISNFSLEFCAKRNNFPDLDKLFAVLSKSLKEAASGCQAPAAAVAED